MRALLFGYKGKMGSIVLEKLEAEDIETIKIEKEDNVLDKNLNKIDFAIDFSDGKESLNHILFCNNNNIPILVCSTGQSEKHIKKIEKIKAKVPLVLCPNTSIGASLLLKFILSLPNNVADSAHIHEVHNKSKKDQPAGTALLFEKALNKSNICCSISSERTNHHLVANKITLYLNDEILELKHTTIKKEVFADGAIEIAKNLKSLAPKVYINNIFREYYAEN